MAAEVKEAVVPANVPHPQDGAPDCRDLLFRLARGPDQVTAFGCFSRAGKSLAVDLAIGGQGQGDQFHKPRGHHIVGERLPHAALQRSHVRWPCWLCPDVVGSQSLFSGPSLDHVYDAVANARLSAQAALNLAKFNAESTDLDLMVHPTEVFDVSIRQVAGQIPGLVQPRRGVRVQRMVNELRGGQFRTVVVTPSQADAADMQLAGHADGHRVHGRVEDVERCIGNGTADRDAVAANLGRTRPPAHIHSSLGWAIQVVQLRREGLATLVGKFHGQCLPTADDALQGGAVLDGLFTEKDLQHRRDEVNRRYAFLPDTTGQIAAVEVPLRFGDNQCGADLKRPEKFPDRHVKAEGRLLHDAIGRAQRKGLLHPVQPVADSDMVVEHAFGFARGT